MRDGPAVEEADKDQQHCELHEGLVHHCVQREQAVHHPEEYARGLPELEVQDLNLSLKFECALLEQSRGSLLGLVSVVKGQRQGSGKHDQVHQESFAPLVWPYAQEVEHLHVIVYIFGHC